MISNIQTGQDVSTGKWWASCNDSKFGECTQWGQDEYEALDKLRSYVELHWDGLWPNIEYAHKDTPQWGLQDCSACQYLTTTYVEGTGLVDWWVHVPENKDHDQLVSLLGRYGKDGPDYWSWPRFMFEKKEYKDHFHHFPANAAMQIWKRQAIKRVSE